LPFVPALAEFRKEEDGLTTEKDAQDFARLEFLDRRKRAYQRLRRVEIAIVEMTRWLRPLGSRGVARGWPHRLALLGTSGCSGRRKHHLPVTTANLSRCMVKALLGEHAVERHRLECGEKSESLSGSEASDSVHDGREWLSAGTQDWTYVEFMWGLGH
jgi:hypothetical protein